MANVKVVARTNEENYELNELLELAQDKIQQAQDKVIYYAYPEINAELIKKLKQIESDIIDLEIMVERQEIMKPVKI